MPRSGFKAALIATSVIALASPAAAATTINATVTGFLAGSGASIGSPPSPVPPYVRRTITNPVNEVVDVYASRMAAAKNLGSTYPHALLGGVGNNFVAFCIEPLESIPIGSAVDYKVVPLSLAASGLGGIGTVKADYIRELFGRNAPNGGFAVMTPRLSAIFQVAIWEILSEQPGTAFNLTTGNMRIGLRGVDGLFDRSDLLTANTWLSRLDGTGPKAKGLVALQNGTRGVQSSGTQDLLAFAAVPEPSNWAMLIAGFGMTGGAMRRRKPRAAVAA
jgi:hypothetical protein